MGFPGAATTAYLACGSVNRIDYQSHVGVQALRDGADYENLGNGWVIDRGMEEIFRRHMG